MSLPGRSNTIEPGADVRPARRTASQRHAPFDATVPAYRNGVDDVVRFFAA